MSSPLQAKPENDEWLTPKEAAHRIGISASFIYKLIKTHQLPASRVGSKLLRIKVTDVDAVYRPTFKRTSQETDDGKAEQ